jgi:hypothetical protein
VAKQALCVGINYTGTDNELRGCLNDADDWAGLLTTQGFTVKKLKEAEATRKEILAELKRLVSHLVAGDLGVFSYSGHGTWLPDRSGDEPDGRDEALCPFDMGEDGANLIFDDELYGIYSRLARGATLVCLMDCCHSGSVYRMALNPEAKTSYRKPKIIPPTHFIRDTSLLLKVDRAYGQASKRSNAPLPGMVHISGCKDSETSSDAEINGRPCGAFSYFATRAFGRGLSLGSTYAEVHAAVRKNLPSWDFQQTPQISATLDMRKTKVFS